MRTPRMPGPTAEEQAMTMRQRKALDKEIAENERRLKRATTARMGKGSLLGMAGGDDELGGGTGRASIANRIFASGSSGGVGEITKGFIKSQKTGQTLKVPTTINNSTLYPSGRKEAAAARFKRKHGVTTSGGMRITRGR